MPKSVARKWQEKRDELYALQRMLMETLGRERAEKLIRDAHGDMLRNRYPISPKLSQKGGGEEMESAEPEIAYKTEIYNAGGTEVEIKRRANGELVKVSFGPLREFGADQIKILKKLAEKGALPELK